MNGPGGDLPLLLWDGSRVRVICGQGPAPAAATIDAYRGLGLRPRAGRGPATPRACRARSTRGCMLLRDFGTWELADVLAFAIGYARDGFPRTPGIVSAIARIEPDVGGLAPRSGSRWTARLRNPVLADTYARLARRAGAVPREARIDAARDAWYRGLGGGGDVAARLPHGRRPGAATRPRSRSRCRCGFRGLDGVQDRAVGPGAGVPAAARAARGSSSAPFLGVEHVHTVIEGAKLAFADREAWYGDSAPVPLDAAALARRTRTQRRGADRRAGVGRAAARAGRAAAALARRGAGARRRGEPTRGDTCHLDVADRFGNLVSRDAERRLAAELAGDPRPRLLPRHARADVLARGGPAVVACAGGVRPRTTLSPSHGACTTTAPCWRSARPAATSRTSGRSSSSSPTPCSAWTCRRRSTRRCSTPTTSRARSIRARRRCGQVEIEGRAPAATVSRAARRAATTWIVADDWSLGPAQRDLARAGRRCCARRANPRGMQGYAVGR